MPPAKNANKGVIKAAYWTLFFLSVAQVAQADSDSGTVLARVGAWRFYARPALRHLPTAQRVAPVT